MILKALCELAEDRHLSDDLDFMTKPVRFQVVVTRDGQASIIDTAILEPAEGKKKPRLAVPERRIPRQTVRTSGDSAAFLVDNCDYVFGCNPKAAPKVAERLPERARLFTENLKNLVSALPAGTEDAEAAVAILSFLNNTEERVRVFMQKWDSCSDEKEQGALATSLFEFEYEPASPTPFHLLPGVVEYWRRQRVDDGGSTETVLCSILGRPASPAGSHPKIRGIPGGAATGTTVVSFNATAFESYGLSSGDNAPISRDAAESYSNALNWLLGKGQTRQNLRISSDSIAVFWAKEGGDDWVLGGLDSDSPESVRHTLKMPQSGRRAALDDPSAFYSILLSSAQARCVVRSFMETTVADAARSMLCYLDDTAIERPYGKGVGNFPLRDLVDSVGVEGRGETVVAVELTTRLYLAALRGLPFQNTVLSAAIRRNKAEAAADEKKNRFKWLRFAARAALVRAFLIRNEGMEVNVTLDRENKEPAYLLGRLFAALDRIQQDALGQVNASTAERYYGAASSTPAAVFPTLLRRNQHHLAKLSKDKPGFAVNREKVLAEIMGGLGSFKRTMTLTEQGLFALGFHHQRQDFFTKKEEQK
jgi:CRISPR-associated protein Csd1